MFHQISDVTTTRTQWLVTLTIEIKPFECFIDIFNADIDSANIVADEILRPMEDEQFMKLINVFDSLTVSRDVLVNSFYNYNNLRNR